MRVNSISVSRYRSINEATKVPLGDFTALTGKNNAGKSNFLRALQIGFAAIQDGTTTGIRLRRDIGYKWRRDFPVSIREKDSGRKDTTIRITFHLTDGEVEDFVEQFSVNISPELQVEVTINRLDAASVKVLKQGPAAKRLNSEIPGICQFINDRINFLYIPAVRTEKDAERIIGRLIQRKIAVTLRGPDFDAALKQVDSVINPLVAGIESDISNTLQTFLPEMKSARIDRGRFGDLKETIVRSIASSLSLNIDDGVDTSLEFKGDGVKSIVAIALFRHGAPSSGSSLLAIEEPEVHLHAGAIREIKRVITEIAAGSQVVISTHSPAFVARDDPRQNIIVDGGSVRPAKNVREIRELMGMRASDNLMHADLALVVEGPSDHVLMSKVFQQVAPDLYGALQTGSLAFESIGGAGKFTYKATTLKREIVPFHAILDRDASGIAAVQAGVDAGLIDHTDYTLLAIPGLNESELEDLFDPSSYESAFTKYGITLGRAGLPGREKWSDRAQKKFLAEGKLWSAAIKAELKDRVADAVSIYDGDVVGGHKLGIVQSIATAIRDKLESATK